MHTHTRHMLTLKQMHKYTHHTNINISINRRIHIRIYTYTYMRPSVIVSPSAFLFATTRTCRCTSISKKTTNAERRSHLSQRSCSHSPGSEQKDESRLMAMHLYNSDASEASPAKALQENASTSVLFCFVRAMGLKEPARPKLFQAHQIRLVQPPNTPAIVASNACSVGSSAFPFGKMGMPRGSQLGCLA